MKKIKKYFWKKTFLQINSAFVSLELLVCIVIIGISVGVFYKLNTAIALNQANMYKGQKLFDIQKSFYESLDYKNDVISSQNGFVYRGSAKEIFQDGIYYYLFLPKSVD